MSWVHTLILVFHMLSAAAIVGLVLLQRGKGAEAGAGFGAGASGTVFGARGSASFLSRSTAVLATLFFVTSLTLAYLGGRPATGTSVMDKVPATQTALPTPVPASPVQVQTAPVQVPENAPATTSQSAPAAPAEQPVKQ